MPRRFRFGICTDQGMDWETTVKRWQLFEKLGFESAWLCDHLIYVSHPDQPYFEAWTLLAALAARTACSYPRTPSDTRRFLPSKPSRWTTSPTGALRSALVPVGTHLSTPCLGSRFPRQRSW